jgi:hypothetical protein
VLTLLKVLGEGNALQSVFNGAVCPVSVFLKTTSALGIAAPPESCIVSEIDP